MTRKECYAALELPEGAPAAEIKRAYRRLAFALHPDLNPDVPNASRRFQRLNEAYVLLTKGGEGASAAKSDSEPDARAREEAHKAYAKAEKNQAGAKAKEARSEEPSKEKPKGKTKEDVLNDILDDPFARRVFEDIYSHIKHDARPKAASGASKASGKQAPPIRKPGVRRAENDNGLMTKVSGWFRKQIDDEQTLRLPSANLVPGAKVRLEIRHGLGGESEVVEITLPPEFIPGKSVRLKGMGRRLGKWRGDLYVRIEGQ